MWKLIYLREKAQSNFILFGLGILLYTKDGMSHTSTPQFQVHKTLTHSVGVGKDTQNPESGDDYSDQASRRAGIGNET